MERRINLDLHTHRGEEIKLEHIDFTRFNGWPVVLNQHKKNEVAIGLAQDIEITESAVNFKVEFNNITESAAYLNFLYNEGLVVAEPGGFIDRDKDGNITRFSLFEISLCKKS